MNISFFSLISEVASRFDELPREKTIKIISHLDTDGITSAAIVIQLLERKGLKYSFTAVPYLDNRIIDEIATDTNECVLFLDVGSGNLDMLDEKISIDKDVFIIDHHKLVCELPERFHMINPWYKEEYEFEGREVCTSGLAYLFAKEIDSSITDMAHIAIIGAIGDNLEKKGFVGINNEILEDALSAGYIRREDTPRFLGVFTRPIHHVLKGGTAFEIPGVTGSEEGVRKLFSRLKISIKQNNMWRVYDDLLPEEKKTLIDAIISKRAEANVLDPDDIWGYTYVMCGEDKPYIDAREFSTIVNACGRMNQAQVGVDVCRGDQEAKKAALNVLVDYKTDLSEAMKWFKGNKKKIVARRFLMIDAKDNVSPNIIGTLASILARQAGSKYDIVLSMARSIDGETTKVSIRSASPVYNMRSIVNEIASEFVCTCGGHNAAAGAIIKTEDAKAFLERAELVLEKYSN